MRKIIAFTLWYVMLLGFFYGFIMGWRETSWELLIGPAFFFLGLYGEKRDFLEKNSYKSTLFPFLILPLVLLLVEIIINRL